MFFSWTSSFLVGCGADLFRPERPRAEFSSSHLRWVGREDFYVAADLDASFVTVADRAAKSWNEAIGRTVLAMRGPIESSRDPSQGLYGSLFDERFVIYGADDWEDSTGKPSHTLATTIWAENAAGEAVNADIIFNTSSYEFVDFPLLPGTQVPLAGERRVVICGRGEDGHEDFPLALGGGQTQAVDLETVLLHEIGHALGLDHVSEKDFPDSIMTPLIYLGPGGKKKLSTHDKDKIRKLFQN